MTAPEGYVLGGVSHVKDHKDLKGPGQSCFSFICVFFFVLFSVSGVLKNEE